MIEITLKISDKESGTPGEVCEEIQKAIENIGSESWNGKCRFSVESAAAKKV